MEQDIERLRAELKEAVRGRKAAMTAMMGHRDLHGLPFDVWPDALKQAFSDAIIDLGPLTTEDLRRTQEWVARMQNREYARSTMRS